jgi:hypothetical protein
MAAAEGLRRGRTVLKYGLLVVGRDDDRQEAGTNPPPFGEAHFEGTKRSELALATSPWISALLSV